MTGFPYVGPPRDGLEQALSCARRRRLRKAGASSGASALAVVLVAVALGQGGRQTLVQNPAPEVPAVHRTDVPTAGGTARPNAVAPGQVGRSTTSRTPGTTAIPPFTPAVDTPSSAGPAADAPPGGPTYRTGRIERADGDVNLGICPLQGAGTFCTSTQVQGPNTSTPTLYADVCSADTSARTLHYPRAQEVDFAVLRGGREVWRWSAFHPPTNQPHVLEVGTGTCTSWTFGWTRVDGSGRPLPAGDYELRTTYGCSEFATQVDTYGFTLS